MDPSNVAKCSGVLWYHPRAFTSAPWSSKSLAIAYFSPREASCGGVGHASFQSSMASVRFLDSGCTDSEFLQLEARQIRVQLYESRASFKRALSGGSTTSDVRDRKDSCKGESPQMSRPFTSAP